MSKQFIGAEVELGSPSQFLSELAQLVVANEDVLEYITVQPDRIGLGSSYLASEIIPSVYAHEPNFREAKRVCTLLSQRMLAILRKYRAVSVRIVSDGVEQTIAPPFAVFPNEVRHLLSCRELLDARRKYAKLRSYEPSAA